MSCITALNKIYNNKLKVIILNFGNSMSILIENKNI